MHRRPAVARCSTPTSTRDGLGAARHQRAHRLLRAARRGPAAAGRDGGRVGAAGSVGHIVGQIAKLHGCRVVGIAGSDDKCGCSPTSSASTPPSTTATPSSATPSRRPRPTGIDVYFDNTGGPVLESALFRMRPTAASCAAAWSASTTRRPPAPARVACPGLLVNNRVRMEGFLVFDYADRYAEARAAMSAWVESAQLTPKVTEFDGLEEAPQAFVELLHGGTVGTTVVKL